MRKIIFLSLLLGLATFMIPFSALALNYETGDNLTLKEDKVIEDNYLIAGNFVTVKGTVRGDLFAFGSTVNIEGTVEGNVFAVAGNVKVSGKIGKDLYVGAGNLEISKEAEVGNDLFVGAGQIDVNGKVNRNLMAGGGRINLNGEMGGDAKLTVGEINFDQDNPAKINGDLTYWSSKEIEIPSQVIIGGETIFKAIAQPNKKLGIIAIMGGKAVSILMALIIGLIVVLLFPKKSAEVNKTMRGSFWRSLGIGFVFLAVVPVAAIILLASILGIPLALILMGIYGLILYLGKVFAALFAGRLLTGENWNLFWSLALGLILVAIIGLIPFVGSIAVFILFLLSLGAIITIAQQTYVGLRKDL